MGPKTNAKARAANERKAGQEADQQRKVDQDNENSGAAVWSEGSKKESSRKLQDEAKRLEAFQKKQEREALLAAEEAELQTAKSSVKKPKDHSVKPGALDEYGASVRVFPLLYLSHHLTPYDFFKQPSCTL